MISIKRSGTNPKYWDLHGVHVGIMSSNPKRVWIPGPLIVGAGPSGLATAACLKQRGVPSLVLDKESCIASSWKFKMYDGLKLHLPKQYCELPMMSFPREFPTYPSREQFIAYLDSYVKKFAIEPLFGVEVRRTEYDSNIGFWRVWTGELEIVCQWLVVATGENAEAFQPEFDGIMDFRGRLLHASLYRSAEEFLGQKVLVVGCGNSAMEICLDLSNNSVQTSMVVRDELHILPREMFGVSTFGLSMGLLKWFPIKVVDSIVLFLAWMILGDTKRYGLRRPNIGPLRLKSIVGKTPVLDVGALAKIKLGPIKILPAINRFMACGVEFVDGRKEDFDSIILATGYRSNVTSWLKEGNFFSEKDGLPKQPFPHSWKGENGLYAVGFTRRGLMGASMDAHKIAKDIASQWDSKTKNFPFST